MQPLVCSAKSVARKLPVATGGLRPLVTVEVAGRTAGSDWRLPLTLGARMTAAAVSCPWQFSWRTAGPPRDLTFGDTVEEIEFSGSGQARVVTDERVEIMCERQHSYVANWNCRPFGDTRVPNLIALQQSSSSTRRRLPNHLT